MKNIHHLIAGFLLLASLASCESSTSPGTTTPVDSSALKGRRLFVLDEGNYGTPNSAFDIISFPLTTGDTVQRSVGNLGDAGNDIKIVGHTVFALFNNSNELKAFNADSLSLLGSVHFALNKPNKLLVTDAGILVTQRNANSVAIVQPSTLTVDSFAFGGGSVAIAALGNKLFISDNGSSLKIVDPATHNIAKSIVLNSTAEQVIADTTNDQIIAGTSGDYALQPSRIYFIAASTGLVLDSISVGTPLTPFTKLIMGSGKLYMTYSDAATKTQQVRQIDLKSHRFLTDLNVSPTTGGYYDGFYDTQTNQLYLAEGDFSSATGHLDLFDADSGIRHKQYITGIGPAHFAFYH